MDCRTCQSLLSPYIDDQLLARDAWLVHTHLVRCVGCTEQLTSLLGALQLLRSLPRLAPTHDPWEAIAFTLRREGLIRPWYARRRPLGAAAVAAALLAVWGYAALHPAGQPANLEAYWRQHAIFTSQEDPALSADAPSLDAIEATYQMQGGDR